MLDQNLMVERTLLLAKPVSEQYVVLFLYAVTSTVQFYDTLLTLDEELLYIWGSKWSPIKGVYLIVRYLSISIYLFEIITSKLLSDPICPVAKWVVALGGMFVGAAADVFLAYRAYAFHGKNKYILIVLIVLFVGWEIAILSLGIAFLPLYRTTLDPVPQLNSILGKNCVSTDYPHKLAAIWVGMLTYQSILFTWVFVKVIHSQYELWRLGLRSSDLYMVCVRDGLWAYFLIVVALVLSVISSIKAQSLLDSSVMLLITTTSICCCRLILNLRSTGSGPSVLITEHSLQTHASSVERRPKISINVSVNQVRQFS